MEIINVIATGNKIITKCESDIKQYNTSELTLQAIF